MLNRLLGKLRTLFNGKAEESVMQMSPENPPRYDTAVAKGWSVLDDRPEREDTRVIRMDWERVGRDLNEAIKRYEEDRVRRAKPES